MNERGVTPDSLALVLGNLQKQTKAIPFRTKKGLIKAGLYIQAESQKLCPVDTGNLRNSAFTIWGPNTGKGLTPNFSGKKKARRDKKTGRFLTSTPPDPADVTKLETHHARFVAEQSQDLTGDVLYDDIVVRVGYGAYYSLFVHEDGVKRNWVGSKFLTRALNANMLTILKLIREEAAF